nr:AAA family ATPase [Rhizobium leguminosarum]
MIGKGNRFPILGSRAMSPADDLDGELPLLLDPTRDRPETHLVYSESGYVSSETERGNITISLLGLNRPALVQQRAETLRRYRDLFQTAEKLLTTEGPFESDIAYRMRDDAQQMASYQAPYAAIVRQFMQADLRRLTSAHGQSSSEVVPVLSSLQTFQSVSSTATPARQKRAEKTSRDFRQRMADYSLSTEDGIRRYKSQRRVIEKISIRNIRALSEINVNLVAMESAPGGWLMLLGENGTGKSTALQAVSLVLAGSANVVGLIKSGTLELRDLVRSGARSGHVEIKLSGFDKPHRLTVFRNRLEFFAPSGEKTIITRSGTVEGTSWIPQTVFVAYGATRLLPRDNALTNDPDEYARIDNLFDPFVPLIDAQQWLSKLPANYFDRAVRVLRDLLAIKEEDTFFKRAGKIAVRTSGGSSIPVSRLSDGYQTVFAATLDILEMLYRIWPNLEDAEGIVLIDEIDAHLHPAWQMQIVGRLRRALPGVQFIATTHQPLCLRGIRAGEVAVMRRLGDGQIEVVSDLPSPEDFLVEQLLTSEFFGLNSTVDPKTEEDFDRYYMFLAMEERSEEQERELSALTISLHDRRQLGTTRRESLYLAAIDKIIAEQKTRPYQPHQMVQELAVREISEIFDNLVDELDNEAGGDRV